MGPEGGGISVAAATLGETHQPGKRCGERLGENEYRTTMTVAGFNKDEFKFEVKEQTLVVSGERSPKTSSGFSCTEASSLATSNATQIADHVEVKGA